ncbi:Hypothetical predicted protein [Xyrichtys novacula]|uniref:Uncharacterized protein n=1 Tax=Xyrichtys novacula TaxID=13765 RepID=A0AAV1FE25_XYRNO|nr:Hypothetical predicted protein [Xyrichtys novacula]
METERRRVILKPYRKMENKRGDFYKFVFLKDSEQTSSEEALKTLKQPEKEAKTRHQETTSRVSLGIQPIQRKPRASEESFELHKGRIPYVTGEIMRQKVAKLYIPDFIMSDKYVKDHSRLKENIFEIRQNPRENFYNRNIQLKFDQPPMKTLRYKKTSC